MRLHYGTISQISLTADAAGTDFRTDNLRLLMRSVNLSGIVTGDTILGIWQRPQY